MTNEIVPVSPPMMGMQIEERARVTLVRLFGDPSNALMPGGMLAMFDGGGLSRIGIEYSVSFLPFGHEARYEPEANEIFLSEATYDDLCCDVPRARFTFAHELGHAILHGRRMRDVVAGKTAAMYRRRKDIRPFMDPEWQANRFAACFLMPADDVRRAWRENAVAARLAAMFMASRAAMERRLKELGLA